MVTLTDPALGGLVITALGDLVVLLLVVTGAGGSPAWAESDRSPVILPSVCLELLSTLVTGLVDGLETGSAGFLLLGPGFVSISPAWASRKRWLMCIGCIGRIL